MFENIGEIRLTEMVRVSVGEVIILVIYHKMYSLDDGVILIITTINLFMKIKIIRNILMIMMVNVLSLYLTWRGQYERYIRTLKRWNLWFY